MGRAYTFSMAGVALEDALSLRQGSFQMKSSETSLQGNLKLSISNIVAQSLGFRFVRVG